jgi:hypothetical protein
MDKKTIVLTLISIIALISLVLGGLNTLKLSNSEWVCIAQECQEFTKNSEEWVNQNCALENNEMICKFQLEGQNIRVNLADIQNVSAMVSCSEYTCSSKVLISYSK